MFTLERDVWEENYQDLSGWCMTPPYIIVNQPTAVPTDEVVTPVLASPKSEDFDFNIELAKSVPKFVNNSEKLWELPSLQGDDLMLLNSITPDIMVSEDLELVKSHPSNTTKRENSNLNIPSMGYFEKNNNLIDAMQHEDDYLTSEFSAPLALVEGKMAVDCITSTITSAFPSQDLQTPDIVEMIIDFPTIKNIENLNDSITSTGSSILLDEVDEGFNLLAYMLDDNPMVKAMIGTGTENIVNKPCISIQPLGKPTIASIKLHQTQPFDSTSTKKLPSFIKGETNSDEEQERKKTVSRKRKHSITMLPRDVPITHSNPSSVSSDTNEPCDKYRELRYRNNEASKKSRLSRKNRDSDMSEECVRMEKVNEELRLKSEKMEKLVKQLRQALLVSVKKK